MKLNKLIKPAIAILAIVIGVFACTVVVQKIVLPDNPKTDNVEEIHVFLDMANGTTTGHTNTNWVFAVLLPKEWNAAETATVTYTTDGLVGTKWWNGSADGHWPAGAEIVNGTMSLCTDEDLEKTSGNPWPSALMAKFGRMGNYYDMEWVVFKSDDLFTLGEDNDNHTIIDVTLKVKTGEERLSFYLAAMYGTMGNGLGTSGGWGDYYASPIKAKMTLLGDGDLIDYTVPPLTSTTPSIFGYDDLVAINFASKAGDVTSVLNGLTDVYLCGKVTLDDGSEISVDKAEWANRMHNVNYSEYQLYIYPKAFFEVPDGKKITNMYVWFRNSSGSKVDNADGALYPKPAKGTPLATAAEADKL